MVNILSICVILVHFQYMHIFIDIYLISYFPRVSYVWFQFFKFSIRSPFLNLINLIQLLFLIEFYLK